MRVIDLTQYADRYILGWDEAKQVSGQPKEDIPWLRLIPGKFGKIFPWSETTFAAYVSGVKKSKQAARLPFVTVVQGQGTGLPGDHCVLFPRMFRRDGRVCGSPPAEAGSPPSIGGSSSRLGPHTGFLGDRVKMVVQRGTVRSGTSMDP